MATEILECPNCGNSEDIASSGSRKDASLYMVERVIGYGSDDENLYPLICFKCEHYSTFSFTPQFDIDYYRTDPLDVEICIAAKAYAIDQSHIHILDKIDATKAGRKLAAEFKSFLEETEPKPEPKPKAQPKIKIETKPKVKPKTKPKPKPKPKLKPKPKDKPDSKPSQSGRAGPWARLPRKCLNCRSSTQGTMEDANNRKLANFSLWPHYEDEDGTTIHALFCFNCGHINNVKLVTLENDKFRFIYVEDKDGDLCYESPPDDLYRYFKQNKNEPEINEYINSRAYLRMINRGYLPKDTGAKELIQTVKPDELSVANADRVERKRPRDDDYYESSDDSTISRGKPFMYAIIWAGIAFIGGSYLLDAGWTILAWGCFAFGGASLYSMFRS